MRYWVITHWRARNGQSRYIPRRRDLLTAALINHRCRVKRGLMRSVTETKEQP